MWSLDEDDDFQGHKRQPSSVKDDQTGPPEEEQSQPDETGSIKVTIRLPQNQLKKVLEGKEKILEDKIAAIQAQDKATAITAKNDKEPGSSDQETMVLQAPMVEVGGAEGALLVYRPWPQAMLIETACQYLPDKAQGGQKIADAVDKMVDIVRPSLHELKLVLSAVYGLGFNNTIGPVHNEWTAAPDQTSGPGLLHRLGVRPQVGRTATSCQTRLETTLH